MLGHLLVDRDLKSPDAPSKARSTSEHSRNSRVTDRTHELAYPDFECHHMFYGALEKPTTKPKECIGNSISYNALVETVRQVIVADDVELDTRGHAHYLTNLDAP